MLPVGFRVDSNDARILTVAMNLRAWLEDAVTPEGIRRDNACVYLTVSRPRA